MRWGPTLTSMNVQIDVEGLDPLDALSAADSVDRGCQRQKIVTKA